MAVGTAWSSPIDVADNPSDVSRLVFAVTAHGLGHLTRTCALANAIAEIAPEFEMHFWTQLPRARVASDLCGDFEYRACAYEPGTAQSNCFEVDASATVRAYQRYLREHDTLLAAEREALAEMGGCAAVVCDVPALAVRAASDLGLPAIAVSNFTWDWILEPLLAGSPAEPAIEMLRDDYRRGTHQIRLPFGPGDSPISSSEPGALISRRATLDPMQVRARIGLGQEARRPVALVCPGGWNADDWKRIDPDARSFDLLLVGDLPVQLRAGDVSLPHELVPPIRFPDLVNAADVVLAKPGYGIASECAAHRTPLVTIDRPDFRETPVLRAEFARLGPCAELSLVDFFAGRWSRSLEEALGSSTRWADQPDRPDRLVAQQVLRALGRGRGRAAPSDPGLY